MPPRGRGPPTAGLRRSSIVGRLLLLLLGALRRCYSRNAKCRGAVVCGIVILFRSATIEQIMDLSLDSRIVGWRVKRKGIFAASQAFLWVEGFARVVVHGHNRRRYSSRNWAVTSCVTALNCSSRATSVACGSRLDLSENLDSAQTSGDFCLVQQSAQK